MLDRNDLIEVAKQMKESSPYDPEMSVPVPVDSRLYEMGKALESLRDAIKTHRSQKADDRCVEDDDRLYEVLGDGIKCDRRVGSPLAMLKNCKRFIRNRCEEGGPWKSYTELEKTVQRFTGDLQCFLCGVNYSPEIENETGCGHRETWGHEWVTPRVLILTQKLFEANEEIKRLKNPKPEPRPCLAAIQGGQCGLKKGHLGPHIWANGD